MKITLITIAIAIVAAVEILRTLIRLKRDRIGICSGLVWLAMWSGIGFFSLFPAPLDSLMAIGQMQNRISFVLLVAVIILFTLVFGLTTQIERLQRELARLAQELALSQYDPADPARKPGAVEPD